MNLVAHGIGGVKDLPVPTWIFYWGGAVVLVISFLLLGSLWKKPLLERNRHGRPVPESLSRFFLSTGLRVAVQAISVALFTLVTLAAFVGETDPFENLAPTWIYVIFWLGLPLLSVLFGNVWRALSPWLAMADGFVWARERLGGDARPLSSYPEAVGRWPAALLLFCFVALELVYSTPSEPRVLAFAIAIYTYVTLFGYAAFGRKSWQENGEGFAVAFAYLARLAPVTVERGKLGLRWPFTGLAGTETTPGSLAVVAVMLGSVAFDGVSRSSSWQNLIARVETPYVLDSPSQAELYATLVNLGGLLGMILLVGLAYRGCCALMRSTVAAPRPLAADFILSLLPIAFVYAVAHYFTLFVIQGQFAIPLISDPLGKGWDLLGTADFRANLAPFSPSTVWYVQAAALVAGHVAGLAVAHDRAVTIFRDRQDALRSQYAMLALMVLYTVGGLWLLSRG